MAQKRKMDKYSWNNDYCHEDAKRLKSVYQHQSERHAKEVEKVITECIDERKKEIQKKRAQSTSKRFQMICQRHAEALYPHIGHQAYAVPPFLIQTSKVRKSSEDMLSTSGFQESDVRGLQAHRKVELAFRMLNYSFEKEQKKCMFIILEYSIENYLRWFMTQKGNRGLHESGKPFKDIAERNRWLGFPRGKTDTQTSGERNNGDLMVLHEEKGVMFVQVKSVEYNDQTDKEMIKKKMRKGKRQLKMDKSRLHARLGSNSSVRVTQVLALPNIVFAECKTFKEMKPSSNIVALCKDHLSTDDTFKEWWGKVTGERIKPSLMKEIIGRYLGIFSCPLDLQPANEHNHVRDFCDAILFTGRLFKRLIFTEEQKNILEKHPSESDNVYLAGPPGSGKTLMLIQRAKLFLESDASRVFVVNAYRGQKGRPVGRLIYKTLVKDTNHHPNIQHVKLDINNEKDCEKKLQEKITKSSSEMKSMFVIDELFPHPKWKPIIQLLDNAGQFYWCAGIAPEIPFDSNRCTTETLTTAIRCPPTVRSVLSQVQVDWIKNGENPNSSAVCSDTERGTDGPAPLCIRHAQHGRYSSQQPVDCPDCAKELAELFLSDLKLIPASAEEGALSSGSDPVRLPCSIVILYNIPRDRYRPASESNHEVEISKTKCNEYINNVAGCRFVRTLVCRVPIRAVNSFDEDFRTECHWDKIPVMWVDTFQGLERDVVVYLPGDRAPQDSQNRRELPVPGAYDTGPHQGGIMESASPEKNPYGPTSKSKTVSRTRRSPQPSTSQQGLRDPKRQQSGLARMLLEDNDIQRRYSKWDQTNLFLAASRCCAQLILILP